MLDFTKLKIGSKVLYSSKSSKKPLKKCKVIYIFKAYKIPKTKKILKYYGDIIVDPKYARIFGPAVHDRIVLKRGKGDYIVFYTTSSTFRYINLEVVKY